MKAHARKEGEIVMGDAELQAEKIIAHAQAKRLQLIQEIDELKRARATYLQQMQGMLDAHRTLLDGIRGEAPAPAAVDDAAARAAVPSDNVSFFAAPRT